MAVALPRCRDSKGPRSMGDRDRNPPMFGPASDKHPKGDSADALSDRITTVTPIRLLCVYKAGLYHRHVALSPK